MVANLVEAVDPYLLLNASSQLFGKAPNELGEEEWRQAVELAGKESLLQQKILDSDEAAGIEVDADELAAAVAGIEAGYASRNEFLQDLARNGMNESTLAESLHEGLIVERIMQRLAGQVTVSDDEVEEYYRTHAGRFERDELREARHILITINNQFRENRRRAVRVRLEKIATELQAHPERFADLAMRHSECPTALEGGYLGKLARDKLYPELDRKLFAMREGEISGILESPMGLHLLYCERVYPAGCVPLDEVREVIRERLLEARRGIAQKQWIKGLFRE